MKSFSKREMRGLLLLSIICLACISIGVLSRKGFISSAVGIPSSQNMVGGRDSLSPSVVMDKDTSHIRGCNSERDGMRRVKRNKRNKGKSARKRTHGISPVNPTRDFLNDTITQNTL